MKTVLIQKQSSVELLLLSREDGVNSVYRGHRQVNCFSRKDRKDLRIPPSHSRQQWSAARDWNLIRVMRKHDLNNKKTKTKTKTKSLATTVVSSTWVEFTTVGFLWKGEHLTLQGGIV